MTNSTPEPLDQLRSQIDAIDHAIVAKIAERLQIVQKIGEYKKQEGITVLDPNREAKLYIKLHQLSQEYNVPLELITHIYDYIMNHSRGMQE